MRVSDTQQVKHFNDLTKGLLAYYILFRMYWIFSNIKLNSRYHAVINNMQQYIFEHCCHMTSRHIFNLVSGISGISGKHPHYI